MEYARNYVFFGGFPWLQTGYTQTDYLILIQISDLAGVYGVSFLVLWINIGIAWGWIGRLRDWQFRWPLIAGGMLIIFSLSYGKNALTRWQKIQPGFRAALLQGNLSDDEPEYIQIWKFQHGYINMAKELKTSVDLLVLPESPAPLTFQYDSAYREALQQLASSFSLGIIFNNIRFASSNGKPTEYFNSAYFLSAEGKELGSYDKIHLVPFGEHVPWKNVFTFIETISKDVGGFSPGTSYDVVHLKNHPANVIICFEAIFPELVREFVRRGSSLIVNLTNDRWYGDTAAPHQHRVRQGVQRGEARRSDPQHRTAGGARRRRALLRRDLADLRLQSGRAPDCRRPARLAIRERPRAGAPQHGDERQSGRVVRHQVSLQLLASGECHPLHGRLRQQEGR